MAHLPNWVEFSNQYRPLWIEVLFGTLFTFIDVVRLGHINMLGYDYESIYNKGNDNEVPNALSLIYEEEGSALSFSLPVPNWIIEV